MPRKNIVKKFVAGGHYHIYNRGIEKRNIFLDEQDYRTFLYLLKQYLSPPEVNPIKNQIYPKTLHGEISLLSYCLMPNHFHLLVGQEIENGITQLLRSISTNYVMYFNKRYNRVGPLFQSAYKAVLIDDDDYLLHTSRYIHLNPFELLANDLKKLGDYPYSSYGDYLGLRNTKWIDIKEILSYFESAKKNELNDLRGIFSYQGFVEDYKVEFDRFENLLLEQEGLTLTRVRPS